MATYRERRERKAEKLREWAEKREQKADEAYDTARMLGDQIPFGQPILVGHHSEKRHRKQIDRIDDNMRKSVEHAKTAEAMESRAGNIELALETSIYDDDPDAIQRLKERLAELEAERDRIKAYNAACRKAKACTAEALALLDERQQKDILGTTRVGMAGSYGSYPGYALSNLSGNIKRNRDRLARLERQASPDYVEKPRYLAALRREGTCVLCGKTIPKGSPALWHRTAQTVACWPPGDGCATGAQS